MELMMLRNNNASRKQKPNKNFCLFPKSDLFFDFGSDLIATCLYLGLPYVPV